MNDAHIDLLTSPGWQVYLEQDVLPWVLSALEPRDLEQLVEIGPGPGLMTELLLAHAPRHVAIEIDPTLAASLRSRFAVSGVEVICADAAATDLDDGRFTAALCLTMIHHVPSAERQDQLLSEVHRLLRPGGRLLGLDSLDGPALRTFHHDDTFVPVDARTLPGRLMRAGFGDPVVERWDPPLRPGPKVRFTATKPPAPCTTDSA